MSVAVEEIESPPATEQEDQPSAVGWNPFTRLAFRFTFLYLGLFCVLYPQVVFVFTGWFGSWLDPDAVLWQGRVLRPVLEWTGRTVFGIHPVLSSNGSGDQAILWVLVFCVLVVALAGTSVWSVLDRRRRDYRRLAGWFLVFLRLCLAGQMLKYGFAKIVPTQMPEPSLSTLLTPYGDLAPMSVLWNQVGTSPAYEMLLGAAELLAGVLLLVPRTATVGAMLAVVSMAQVFVLNMTFDVPVKILSGHLLLISMALLAPQARRLFDVLVLDRPVGRSTAPYPFRTRRSRLIAGLVQAGIGVWVAVALAHVSTQLWDSGSGRPKPPLYGIWAVEEFTRDGQSVPPLLTDAERWQRVVFDYPGVMQYQRTDGTLVPTAAEIDTGAHRLALAAAPQHAGAQPVPLGEFAYEQQRPDVLRFTGELAGHPVTVSFRRQDPDAFPQRSHGFRWVQNAPGQ
ncbi:DoxX family protein [Nocardia sp. NPDC052254]|uniref:DoxX family protein n=1 Tax=Nocardia sp. NPDC052254 TaxID=3155681 RepID=UPI00342FF8D6